LTQNLNFYRIPKPFPISETYPDFPKHICATLNNACCHIEEYEIDEYNEEQMEEMIMAQSSDDNEQIPFQKYLIWS